MTGIVTPFSTALLISVIAAATVVGRAGISEFKVPWLTAITGLILGVCLVAQVNRPELLFLMERNRSAIHLAQAYRLFTALWFQDGGLPGATFNIAVLAVVGSFAEQVFSRQAWLGIYLIGGLMSEFVGLAWQPVGAGNSVAYMSLAGALLASSVHRVAAPANRFVGAFGVVSGVALCLTRDVHGAAVVIGFTLVLLVHRFAATPAQ